MSNTTFQPPLSRETPQSPPPDPAAVEPCQPTERHLAPNISRASRVALPESLDLEVQCALRLIGPEGPRYGTAVRLFAEGLTLLTHEAPVVGGVVLLEIDLDEANLVHIEAVVVSARRPDPTAPARVTVRWAELRPAALGRLAAWVDSRTQVVEPHIQVLVAAQPLPQIRRGGQDPTVAVTELGETPRRGWIATLRQRVRGVRPDVRGPALPPFRGHVVALPDGVSLLVAWSGEAAWRSDWTHYLADGQLPLPPGMDGGERRRVLLRLPDGSQREASAQPLRGDRLALQLDARERPRSVSTASR